MSKSAVQLQKIWTYLLAITSVLFAAIAIIKIAMEEAFLQGFLMLVIANTFAVAVYLFQSGRLIINPTSRATIVFLSMGFIFIIVGSSALQNVGIAGFGYVLFVAGLFLQKELAENK
ncbi:MAG: hypothetical protein B7C24_07420 [Bacteroidetes bacterium 4572_77]|nr:MAG: hypothetical protein B7C24_07420 [Bacteroidetes bacterium 4572_77]